MELTRDIIIAQPEPVAEGIVGHVLVRILKVSNTINYYNKALNAEILGYIGKFSRQLSHKTRRTPTRLCC